MLLSALSVLVVAQSSSEIPVGLTNNPVFFIRLCSRPSAYDSAVHGVHNSVIVYLHDAISRATVVYRRFFVNSVSFTQLLSKYFFGFILLRAHLKK